MLLKWVSLPSAQTPAVFLLPDNNLLLRGVLLLIVHALRRRSLLIITALLWVATLLRVAAAVAVEESVSIVTAGWNDDATGVAVLANLRHRRRAGRSCKVMLSSGLRCRRIAESNSVHSRMQRQRSLPGG